MNKEDFIKSLNDSSLDCYTSVEMARKSITENDFGSAIGYLKTDMDKLICHNYEMYQFVQNYKFN